MKNLLIMSLLFTLFYSCQEEINVTLSKEPGKITGSILPMNVITTVKLYQGNLINQVNTKNGVFEFKNVEPGVYRILAKADNYGRKELTNIKVSDGEGCDVGIIELSIYPYPLSEVYPYDGQKDVEPYYDDYRILLNFSKHMLASSVEKAFKIEPEGDHLSFNVNSSFTGSRHYYYFYTKLDYGTTYTFTIDTTAETYYGEKLEFPYSSTFTTENFKVVDFYSSYRDDYSNWPVRIGFNGYLSDDFADHISVDPSISYYIDTRGYDKRIYIYPNLSWIPDTTITIHINENLQEVGGTKLQQDTSFTFTVAPLKVVNTVPYSNQHFVSTETSINIRMNNILDESSIQSAVSISPEVYYSISTYTHRGYTQFTLNPDTLQSDTEYTVSLNSSLKDYYGGSFKQGYSFSFNTE